MEKKKPSPPEVDEVAEKRNRKVLTLLYTANDLQRVALSTITYMLQDVLLYEEESYAEDATKLSKSIRDISHCINDSSVLRNSISDYIPLKVASQTLHRVRDQLCDIRKEWQFANPQGVCVMQLLTSAIYLLEMAFCQMVDNEKEKNDEQNSKGEGGETKEMGEVPAGRN